MTLGVSSAKTASARGAPTTITVRLIVEADTTDLSNLKLPPTEAFDGTADPYSFGTLASSRCYGQ